MYQEPSPENRADILNRYDEKGRMLRSCEVISMLAISRTSLWRYERAGTVPPGKVLGSQKYWRLSSVLHCIETLPTDPSHLAA